MIAKPTMRADRNRHRASGRTSCKGFFLWPKPLKSRDTILRKKEGSAKHARPLRPASRTTSVPVASNNTCAVFSTVENLFASKGAKDSGVRGVVTIIRATNRNEWLIGVLFADTRSPCVWEGHRCIPNGGYNGKGRSLQCCKQKDAVFCSSTVRLVFPAKGTALGSRARHHLGDKQASPPRRVHSFCEW